MRKIMNAIEACNVTKTYGEGASATVVLRGVDFAVKPGEIVLLMGPSGSGKTTLVSIMGCILQATSGSVKVLGQEVVGLPERRLPQIRLNHLGFIFQGFNLFPALTVGENVELALDLKGIRGRAAKQRAGELLERVEISHKLNELPANLSGGQKQRVAIARALAGDPAIILADEPTAALDSHSGQLVIELLRDLAHERGRAVVIVTHDDRILSYADRIVRIADGRILDSPIESEPHSLALASTYH
jgi:putative ABC transport system ATP-binding protein